MGFWQLGEGDPRVVAWITQGSTCPKAQGLPMRVWPMDLRPTATDSQLSPPPPPPPAPVARHGLQCLVLPGPAWDHGELTPTSLPTSAKRSFPDPCLLAWGWGAQYEWAGNLCTPHPERPQRMWSPFPEASKTGMERKGGPAEGWEARRGSRRPQDEGGGLVWEAGGRGGCCLPAYPLRPLPSAPSLRLSPCR